MLKLVALLSLLASPALAFPVERCVNLSNGLEAPREGDWGYVIERDHLRAIAQAGFDTVRLPVRFSAHLNKGTIDPALLARVDEVIGWAQSDGLTVILDVHHFEEIMQDPDSHSATLIAMWDQLGAHFAQAPPTLLFEILNEPNENLTTARMTQLNSQIIARLRAAHPTRWIITGGGDWGAYTGLQGLAPAGPYEARTFHYYAPYDVTHQLAGFTGRNFPAKSWGTAQDLANLSADFEAITTLEGPLFLGEFGVYYEADQNLRADYLSAVRRAAESQGIPWCVWGFGSAFRIYDPDNRAWVPRLRDALLRD